MEPRGPLVCPVLVGRDDLLALATRRCREAVGGRGGMLLLSGEAGIGKSRLLGATERSAAAAGMAVVRAAAFPSDAEVAGGLFLDLARALERTPGMEPDGHALGDLFREHRPGEGDAHRRRRMLVLDAVDRIAAVASTGPALVSLEDLHWADDLTLEVLAVLARRLPELPLLVVGTYRSDELYPASPLRDLRSRLVAARLAEEVRVARLDRDGVATMATLLVGNGLPARAELVDAVHARSDGIPLHVEELLGLLRDHAPGEAVPDTLEHAILARAATLSPRARRVADTAAVIGRSFDIPTLAAVMRREPDRLAAPIAELEQAFFVVRTADADRRDFRHALIRDALYRAILEPDRRRLHGRVADVAAGDAGTGDSLGPAFRSGHLEAAGRRPAAHTAALEGARLARSLSAHREAYDLLRRAWRTLPTGTGAAERAALLEALGDEAAAIDHNDEADGWYTDAAARWREAGAPLRAADLAASHVAVRHLLGDGLPARVARLEAAIRTVDTDESEAGIRVRGRLLAGLAAAHMLDRRLDTATAYADTARTLAARSGDLGTELDASATLGSCHVFAGRMDEGWTLLQETPARARAHHLEAAAARAYRMLASCASVLVEYGRGEPWLHEGIEYAERVELWNHRHYLAGHLAHVRWATGRLEDADALAARVLADGDGGLTTRITALHVRGYVALARGSFDEARTTLEEALALAEGMGELQRRSPALWGLAEVALLAGDVPAALRACARGEALSAAVADAAYLFPYLVTGTRAHLLAGDPAAAEAWVDRVGAAIRHRGIPGTLPAVGHAQGLVLAARGATGRARSALAGAHAAWTELGRWWEGSWAALDLAGVLARTGRPGPALALAEEIVTAARAAGSRPLEDAGTALVRRVRARSSAPSGWEPLTPRELEVARAIATGATNAAIAEALGVSPRTVTAHVEHILAKLGAARRSEVAAWIASRDGAAGRVGAAGDGGAASS